VVTRTSDAHPGRVSLIEWAATAIHLYDANSGRWQQGAETAASSHCLGEICRDEMIAAALADHHLKRSLGYSSVPPGRKVGRELRVGKARPRESRRKVVVELERDPRC
jgi:hypothetical protein